MARSRSSGRPWLWPASRKFVPSLPWTSRTPPNAWPPASFPSLRLCEFIPISAASALNPASVNSLSAALRIPSSIASAPTASSSPPSPTPSNLDKLPSPYVRSADAGDEGWVVWIRFFVLACPPWRAPPHCFTALRFLATCHRSAQSLVGRVGEGLPPAVLLLFWLWWCYPNQISRCTGQNFIGMGIL